MKKVLKIFIILIILGLVIVGSAVLTYFSLIKAPSKEGESVNIVINAGDNYNSISKLLKENNLIKNELAYKIYIKLNTPTKSLEAGEYDINNNLSIEELIKEFEKGTKTHATTKIVKFLEGKNMRNVIKTITSNFESITEKEILSKLKDNSYLDELIDDYWFLTKDIKNKDIYYSLEGYLFPDTYEFYTDADLDDIFRKMLDNMEDKLEKYKSKIKKSKYSVHEIITLSSIVELEAGSADRKKVAGVFYNRLKSGWTLGSDVTGYYGAKMDNWTNGLGEHRNDCNAYNTRGTCVKALPVGPICNPSIKSIEATLNPDSHKYYYFVADCSGKTYLNYDIGGHDSTVAKLRSEGKWCDK